MKIVVDAFGGDYAPYEIVAGAVKALQENQAVKMPEPKVEVKAVQTQPTQPIAQPIIQPQAQKVAQASTMQSVSLQNFIKAHSK